MVAAEASLWSHIDMKARTRCAELFLQRSSGRPLSLYAFFNLNQVALPDHVLEFHASRARAIHIDHQCKPSEWENLSVLNRFFWSAPQIECFVLQALFKLRENVPLEWRLFAEETSPLKALRLHIPHVWYCLPTNYFSNLTHPLLWSGTGGDYPTDQLFDLLSRTPMLQYLQLVIANFLISPEFEPDPALALVSLPHVRTVCIHCTELECALFILRYLDLPEECAVCINGGGTGLDFSQPATFPHADAFDILLLRLLDIVTSMDLSAWFDGFHIGAHNAPRFSAGLFVQASGCYNHCAWLAHAAHATLPFPNITVLHVSIDEPNALALVFPPILAHFPRVHELGFLLTPVHTGPPRTNDRALVELFLSALLPNTDGTVCPNLKVLAHRGGASTRRVPVRRAGAYCGGAARRGPPPHAVRVPPAHAQARRSQGACALRGVVRAARCARGRGGVQACWRSEGVSVPEPDAAWRARAVLGRAGDGEVLEAAREVDVV